MNNQAKNIFSEEQTGLVIASNSWNLDEFGGADKIATDLAIFCAAQGRRVHYIASTPEKAFTQNLEQGVTVWRYPRPGSGLGRKSPWHFLTHMRRIGEAMRRIRKDQPADSPLILNGHTALQQAGLIRAARGLGFVRLVSSVHSPMAEEYRASWSQEAHPGLSQKVTAGLMGLIERYCYAHSDAVQCFSAFTRGLLQRDFGHRLAERLIIVPGYVDYGQFASVAASRAQARERLRGHWRTRETVFFCLRRHTERMGIDNLIRACALIGASAQFRLLIGGEGHLRPYLENLTKALKLTDKVFFTGRIPESDLALAYRAADCFVLPTRALECFGLVILEAFAAGTPVIATPVGAIPEVLGPFGPVSLARSAVPEDLADAMKNFLEQGRHEGPEEDLRAYARSFDKAAALGRLLSVLTDQ